MSRPPEPGLLVLGRGEVETLLDPDACRVAMRAAMIALFEGRATQPNRTVIDLGEGASGLFMPALLRGAGSMGAKVVAIHPDNARRGMPSHHAALLVFETRTGRPRALIEGSSVTAIRTAAVSALATDLLARPEAEILALLGTGVQAESHLDALLRVRQLREVRVWSRRAESRRRFLDRVRHPEDVRLAAVESPEAAVRGADIVTTVSAAGRPIVSREWLASGVHLNAVGASTATRREIDSATVEQAGVIVDSRAAALDEAGDLLLPIAEGRFAADRIRAELGGVAAGREPGRRSAEEITLFKSVGLAVQDLAAAALLVDEAERRGVGRRIDWS